MKTKHTEAGTPRSGRSTSLPNGEGNRGRSKILTNKKGQGSTPSTGKPPSAIKSDNGSRLGRRRNRSTSADSDETVKKKLKRGDTSSQTKGTDSSFKVRPSTPSDDGSSKDSTDLPGSFSRASVQLRRLQLVTSPGGTVSPKPSIPKVPVTSTIRKKLKLRTSESKKWDSPPDKNRCDKASDSDDSQEDDKPSFVLSPLVDKPISNEIKPVQPQKQTQSRNKGSSTPTRADTTVGSRRRSLRNTQSQRATSSLVLNGKSSIDNDSDSDEVELVKVDFDIVPRVVTPTKQDKNFESKPVAELKSKHDSIVTPQTQAVQNSQTKAAANTNVVFDVKSIADSELVSEPVKQSRGDAKEKANGDAESEDEAKAESIKARSKPKPVRFSRRSNRDVDQSLKERVQSLESSIKAMKQKYETAIQTKVEEITRLRNDIAWKNEQLNEMNSLVEKNMELEAHINAMLSDKKEYEREVDKYKERETTKTTEKKKNAESEQMGEAAKKKSPQKNKRGSLRSGRKTRQSKDDDGLEEDIDALFMDNHGDSDSEEDVSEKKTEIEPQTISQSSETNANHTPEIPASSESTPAVSVENLEMEEANDVEKGDKKHDGRKEIRKVMTGKKLTEETKQAAKDEKERIERVKKEHDKHIVVVETDKITKQPVTTKLVLACKEGTKTPLVEVSQRLVKKLKPHQVEGIEFVWDSLIESMDMVKEDEEGAGCILAHCMGLGKTLTLISFIHTLLTNKELKKNFRTCLVVCPLNTVLNWQFEWKKWLEKKDRLPVYELASARSHPDRIELFKKWHKTGGILIMGYQLFRILASYTGKSKKTKKVFDESLLDPGPDLVVCDEGHVLKNDSSGISKCMNKIRTKRRVVLTGTPLQNNLIEYHCMVNFVKPNLLGTRREFGNRFVNPITNGQHSDSTKQDVRIMKRRAHILHELLSGCVQRKDYSCLTKLLPPKHEYVVSVRLSQLQMKLYEEYLKVHMPSPDNPYHGASLFSDYQCLMRIWTHPWVLKLDELRQEKKRNTKKDVSKDSTKAATKPKSGYSSDRDDDLDSLLGDSDEEDDLHLTLDTDEDESVEPKDFSKDKTNVNPPSTRSSRSTRQSVAATTKEKSDENNSLKCEDSGPKKKKIKENGFSKTEASKSKSSEDLENGEIRRERRAKVIAGEVIKTWRSSTRRNKDDTDSDDDVKVIKEQQWWHQYVSEEHQSKLELSGKLILMFEILRMCETIGDKVLVFSQSLLSLDLIEEFLKYKTEGAEKRNESKKKRDNKESVWVKDEDYLRMDGSTGASKRSSFTEQFNKADNTRLRLFLISTRAGGLGINLERANRVIIFDASWNPSHDVQSIFRVYRFGQEKDVYVYRFLAQGTMEDKIYTRQVTKETLSQRVIDEHQIDRHFSAADLQELYKFTPDRLEDPDRKEKTPPLPKDVVLAELMSSHREWIVDYHNHDSLLENRPEEDLSEEERKAAWEDYEREKRGIFQYRQYSYTPNYQQPSTSSGLSTTGQLTLPKLPSFNTTGMTFPAANAMSGHAQQKFQLQMTQLPRVVQEILKYNPNITGDELQKRLQAFLGIHGKQTVPGFAMTPQAPPAIVGTTSAPVTVPFIGMPGVVLPGISTPLQYLPLQVPGFNLPSRLPQPGRVPASNQPQPPALPQ